MDIHEFGYGKVSVISCMLDKQPCVILRDLEVPEPIGVETEEVSGAFNIEPGDTILFFPTLAYARQVANSFKPPVKS
jgi:hypothetical protein